MNMEQKRVAGIILAAGQGSRMGKTKQLLSFQGKTILEQVIDNALKSNLHQVIVVIGHDAHEIQRRIDLSCVEFVLNEDYEKGQSSSLKKGVAAASPECEAAMFLLADQPLVGGDIIDFMIQAFLQKNPPIAVPVCNNKRGNPVIIHRDLFPQLQTLTQDTGARVLFHKYQDKILRIEVEDDAVLFDVDTWEDYQKLQKKGLRTKI